MSAIFWNTILGCYMYKPSVKTPTTSTEIIHYEPFAKMVNEKEGSGNYIMDKNGFNNDEIIRNNKKFVLVLGDSHTEAEQVKRDDNFCSVAENKLASASIIYNAGVSGLSMADYIGYGQVYMDYFNPNKVIIQVTYDDFTSNATLRSKDTFIAADGQTYAIIKRVNYMQNSSFDNLKEKVRCPFVYNLYFRLSDIVSDFLHPKLRPFLPKYAVEISRNIDCSSLIDWQVSQIKHIFGDKAAFLYLPSTPMIGQQGTVEWSEYVENDTKLKIVSACNKYGVDFIDLQTSFNILFKKTQHFPRGFNNTDPSRGHLNKFGHYATGVELANYLKSKGF
ncbi:SGNH/GDSL hydrolase family protein [Desulfofarcimen acetoxidans]|uniref:SGNH/GDSL hydrolase family protein n=1 Tax=Desulfofarcimen acetoxidans TaxID=58138 RepID=UPI00138A0283|nr:SGNH/GDSL hydrolase family protein [Desulfofarcimen acetoxidans]